jgi:hypothetical protein
MSFQAKKLRVQLPCGEATLIEEGAEQAGAAAGFCRIPSLCRFPTQICWGGTCHFGTVACHGFFTNCGFVSPCRFDTCGGIASVCEFGTPCGGGTIFRCPGGSEQPVDPGTIVVDPEHLPALREALEAQLKEIETAEKALKERG